MPILDAGARGATITFAQRRQGDVLLSWENEAFLALNEFGRDKFEIEARKSRQRALGAVPEVIAVNLFKIAKQYEQLADALDGHARHTVACGQKPAAGRPAKSRSGQMFR